MISAYYLGMLSVLFDHIWYFAIPSLMVFDPVSIAVVSSISSGVAGMVLGKLSKKKTKSSFSSVVHQNRVSQSEIHFIGVDNLSDPQDIIAYAKDGNPVFINVNKLMHSTEDMKQFMVKLKEEATNNYLTLHRVSKDLVLIKDPNQAMQIHSLTSEQQQPIDPMAS